MKWKSPAAESEENLDISPLIDVVFILLIFFMVTTTFQKDLQLEIQRPEASSSEPAEAKTTRVQIEADGGVFLNGESVPLWSLTNTVKKALGGHTKKSVLVVSDKMVPAETLVRVVDACRLAGADQVGVATDPAASAGGV